MVYGGSSTVVVIGAGPAGLTAAYELAKNGVAVVVLEADPQYVGGISRTVNYKGFHFDIGGHRFFSKSAEIENLWTEILPDGMLQRPRKSRIYYGGKFFNYPLKPLEALAKLGPAESFLCMASYVKARFFPATPAESFEDWVSNHFGQRLFRIFFKTYTEKVWGMSCKELSADWAAQRIKGLSLFAAIRNGLFPAKSGGNRGEVIKTLIDSFRYPKKGPGMMWETCARKVRERGGQVLLGHKVRRARLDPVTGEWTVEFERADGTASCISARHVISSAALGELLPSLIPAPNAAAVDAARGLRYRDFLTVAVIAKRENSFDDNWIYIHDPSVRVGRVQNYGAWSPEMVPDARYCCYGLEYFCSVDDPFWSTPDSELLELAKRELGKIGLARPHEVEDGCVVRQPKAYPVYDGSYSARVATIREEIATRYPNLHVAGRNGMHRYNNQDHAMMTGLLAARNILAGKTLYDVWRVNQDAEYLEAGAEER